MDDFACSFCGRLRRQVRKLISGPRVFVCNECVADFRKTMDETFPPPPPPKRPPAPPQGQPVSGDRISDLLAAHEGNHETALRSAYGLAFVNLDEMTAPADVVALVPSSIAWHHNVVPIGRTDKTITLAMADPNSGTAIAAVADATGLEVRAAVAAADPVHRALRRYYPRSTIPPRETRPCSFCGKAPSELDMLFVTAGSDVTMCDECLGLCEDIVAEDLKDNGP